MGRARTFLAVALAAAVSCGGGRDKAEVATLHPTAAAPAAALDETRFDAMLNFAECMRERGVDVADPEETDGSVSFVLTQQNVDDPDFTDAQEACSHLLPRDFWGPDLSPEEEAAELDRATRYAQCMREQGIDLPDPEPGGPYIGLAPGVDPDSPEFMAADRECGRFLQPRVSGE
jgi:hypothetical protein